MTGVAFTASETRVDTLAQRVGALGLDRVPIAESDACDALLALADIAARTTSDVVAASRLGSAP